MIKYAENIAVPTAFPIYRFTKNITDDETATLFDQVRKQSLIRYNWKSEEYDCLDSKSVQNLIDLTATISKIWLVTTELQWLEQFYYLDCCSLAWPLPFQKIDWLNCNN